MYVVGLTGGIGTGKSTVAAMLADRGAVVIDADVIARQVVESGSSGFREVVDAFGPEVVGEDGELDRARVASIVFADAEARERLNSIVHPRVYERITERLGQLSDTDAVVVLDVPLLVESASGSSELVAELIVVEASQEAALDRLERRGVERGDALRRMAAQLPISEKVAVADHVLHNDGSLAELEAQVEELWAHLTAKAGAMS